jgi:hypothetical protein
MYHGGDGVRFVGIAVQLGGFSQDFCRDISASVTTSGAIPTFGLQQFFFHFYFYLFLLFFFLCIPFLSLVGFGFYNAYNIAKLRHELSKREIFFMYCM